MIVWLASYPKSGNTWLRKFIQAYLVGPPFNINAFHPQFLGDVHTFRYQDVCNTPITELKFRDQLYLRYAVLWNMLKEQKDKALYLKTHHALTRQEDIELFPPCISGGAIYIVRDPRDVAISFGYHMGYSIDDAIGAITNPTTMVVDWKWPMLSHGVGAWSAHVKGWTERDYPLKRVVIRYEDMVRKPHTTFRTVLKAISADYDQERFNFALRSTRFRSMQQQEQESGFAERSSHNDAFFRRGKPGGWKDTLTEKQVARIEAACRPMMEKFRYEFVA